MDRKKAFMIGAGIILLIIILRNITFVSATPVETTKTTTVVYKQPVQKAYYVPPAGHYNSYKAQYYN